MRSSTTNLRSIFLCSKHAIPLLRAAGGGAIVNLSSVMGIDRPATTTSPRTPTR